jgi:hypothetical protein
MPYTPPKINRCINFLKFVTENYSFCAGGQEWTDKKGKKVYTIEQMYKEFNKQNKRYAS